MITNVKYLICWTLIAMLGVSACSDSKKSDTSGLDLRSAQAAVAKASECEPLVGKPLPRTATDDGCLYKNTLRATVTYTCRPSGTLILFAGEKSEPSFWARDSGVVQTGTWTQGSDAAIACSRGK